MFIRFCVNSIDETFKTINDLIIKSTSEYVLNKKNVFYLNYILLALNT